MARKWNWLIGLLALLLLAACAVREAAVVTPEPPLQSVFGPIQSAPPESSGAREGVQVEGAPALQCAVGHSTSHPAFREIIPLEQYDAGGEAYLFWSGELLTDLSLAAVCLTDEGDLLEQGRSAALAALSPRDALTLNITFREEGGYKLSYTRADGVFEACLIWPEEDRLVRLSLLAPSVSEPSRERPCRMDDDDAYALLQSGALDTCIPKGDEIFDAVCADLNSDGITDVLMLTESAAPRAAMYGGDLRTLLLLGDGAGGFAIAARDDGLVVDYIYNHIVLHAGDGWFKLEDALGRYGGVEECILYEYDSSTAEWALAERYYNYGGYYEQGVASILTPINFGRWVFGAGPVWDGEFPSDCGYTYEHGTVSVSGSYPVITLEDEAKAVAVNMLIADGYLRIAEYLQAQDADVKFYGNLLLQTPRVLCVEYEFSGSVGGLKLTRRATLLVDMETARRLTLADFIATGDWRAYVCNAEDWIGDESGSGFDTLPDGFDRLPEFCDDFDAIFEPGGAGFFCALHERSLAVYWQPDFWNPAKDGKKVYLIKDLLETAVRWSPWAYESRAAEHIEWMG